MDLDSVAVRLEAEVAQRYADQPVRVRVVRAADGSVVAEASCSDPLVVYLQSVWIQPSGEVTASAADDGFTSVGAEGTAFGTFRDEDGALGAVLQVIGAFAAQ